MSYGWRNIKMGTKFKLHLILLRPLESKKPGKMPLWAHHKLAECGLFTLVLLSSSWSHALGQQARPASQESTPAATSHEPPGAPQNDQRQQPVKPGEKPTAKSPSEIEADALERAVHSAQGNPQALIKNLEEFLQDFPQSPRREQILRVIYQKALQANDPRAAQNSAEKLLELHPDDPTLLSSIVDLLDRENDAASFARATLYATKFIDHVEDKLQGQNLPKSLMNSGGKPVLRCWPQAT